MGENVSCVYLCNSSGVNLFITGYEDGGLGTVMISDCQDGVVTIGHWQFDYKV